ncbi:MAG: N-acetylmuramoyl-L-alanine amidase [Terriglobia bacterium]
MTTILRQRLTVICLAAGLAVLLVLWPARRLRSENFVFYLPNQHKLITVQKVGDTNYLPLIPLLNLRGPVAGLQEKRNSLKVWVGGDQLQFHLDRNKVQVNKTSVILPQPVLRVDGEWIVPEAFLTSIFARIAGPPFVYRAGSTRAFVGDVHPLSYTVRLESQPSGARLVIQFTGKVTAESESHNGKWVIFLGGAPIEPLEQSIRFESPYLKALQFDDQDGRPKLIITPKVAGMNFYPVLADGQQTLVADFRVPQVASAPQSSSAGRSANPGQSPHAAAPMPSTAAGSAAPPASSGPGAKPAAAVPAPAPPPPLPAIVLDAGHGGPDAGARSRDGILEKNLVAALVAKVSDALQATQKVRVILTRAGDSDPTFEDRTITANTARPVAFLTFHAGEMGSRLPVIRVYTYESSSHDGASDSGTAPVHDPSVFIPWISAQRSEQARSQQLAADLVQRFSAISGATVPSPWPAPVRQLRSVAAPAVAIELGTLSPDIDAGVLNQPAFQQQVANAAAAALLQFVGGAAKP